MQFVWFLIIGGVAGWLAGLAMKGRGFGVVGNIIVGVIGALVGGFLIGLLGFNSGGGLVPALVSAFIGSVVLLAAISFIKKK